MNTNKTNSAQLEPSLEEDVLATLSREQDPAFAARLRGELRGRHARGTRNLHWFEMDLPVGRIRLVHDGALVHLVTNHAHDFDALTDRVLGFEPAFGESKEVAQRAASVFAGRLRGSELVYLGDLPRFQQAILRITASIPRGQVRPYGWVARRAGSRGAVRAAGTALGHNPVPFIVPCHRVIRSDWHLGQYSAGGEDVKGSVLRWEGFEPRDLEPLAAAKVRILANPRDGTFCVPVCGPGVMDPRDYERYNSPEEAAAAGFVPCENCLPA